MTSKLHISVSNIVFLVSKSEKVQNTIDKALLDKQQYMALNQWLVPLFSMQIDCYWNSDEGQMNLPIDVTTVGL